MLPSSTLMFTSNSNTSIPDPVKIAFAYAITDVVCAQKFFHGEYYAARLQESRSAIGATLLKELNHKPHDQLAEILAPEMARVDALIQERMRSENAPRIPEVTAHLVNAGANV